MTGGKEYGKALFELASEGGREESILSEIKALSAILKDNPDYVQLIDTPALKKSERLSLIDEAFSSLDEYLLNLLKILCEGRMLHAFPEICETYTELYEASRKILRVEAVTAIPLTEKQNEALINKLSNMTGSTVILSNTVDEKILGGIKLRYGNTQLDGSVKTQLDGLARSLKASILQ